MDNKRNPKICLNVLNDLANRNPGNNKLNNWINSFKIICQNIDKNFVLTYSIGDLEKARDKIINLYLKNKIIEDNEKALSSNSLSYFAFLNHKENCNFYANIKVSLYLQRILAQCRMINRHASRILINNNYLKLDNYLEAYCTYCNALTQVDLKHLIFDCNLFTKQREKLFPDILNDSIIGILEDQTPITVKNLYLFLYDVTKAD